MHLRRLGGSDLRIAPLVLGGNVFGWTADAKTSFDLLDHFVDAGFNAIDTADAYSIWAPGHVGGESETVIGDWLQARGRRDRIVLATKVGALLTGRRPDGSAIYGHDLSAKRIVAGVEASLRRLKTDFIDLYQTHAKDPSTPTDEILEALNRLVMSGKVRTIGASNHSAQALSAAIELSADSGWAAYESLQPLYNLYDRRGFEDGLLATCATADVGVICQTALAKGFLTGKYRTGDQIEASAWALRLKHYQTPRGRQILDALDVVGREQCATPAQVALAWLITQPGVTAAIVAADSVLQLNEIMHAVDLRLTPWEVNLLATASAEHALEVC